MRAPRGFSVRLSKGVYVLEKSRVSASFSRLATTVTPSQLGAALTQQPTAQQTAEFRSQTTGRQSRDVGCLLQGYYVVEDNSRRYNLPPLPCGQIYTERG